MMLIISVLIGGGGLGFIGLTRAGAPGMSPAPTSGVVEPASDLFNLLVPLVAVAAMAVAFIMPRLLVAGARRRWESRADDEAAMRRVFQGFMTMSVLQGTALELPGVLGAVATLLTGNWLMLLATVASVVALAVVFPRRSSIEGWIDDVTGGCEGGIGEAPENP